MRTERRSKTSTSGFSASKTEMEGGRSWGATPLSRRGIPLLQWSAVPPPLLSPTSLHPRLLPSSLPLLSLTLPAFSSYPPPSAFPCFPSSLFLSLSLTHSFQPQSPLLSLSLTRTHILQQSRFSGEGLYAAGYSICSTWCRNASALVTHAVLLQPSFISIAPLLLLHLSWHPFSSSSPHPVPSPSSSARLPPPSAMPVFFLRPLPPWHRLQGCRAIDCCYAVKYFRQRFSGCVRRGRGGEWTCEGGWVGVVLVVFAQPLCNYRWQTGWRTDVRKHTHTHTHTYTHDTCWDTEVHSHVHVTPQMEPHTHTHTRAIFAYVCDTALWRGAWAGRWRCCGFIAVKSFLLASSRRS